MSQSNKIVKTIKSHFYSKRTHTAGVLSGPKRETWFSAECFVALAEREISEEGPLSYWGERSHAKIAERLNTTAGEGDESMIPDIVAILPSDGKKAVGTIIETKLILTDDNPTAIIKDLKNQMLNAEKLWPGASVLGLIFIAGMTHTVKLEDDKRPKSKKKKKEKEEKKSSQPIYPKLLKEIELSVNGEFTSVPNFRWIKHDHEYVHRIFDDIYTDFAWPSMHFSLALCSIELSSVVLPLADPVEGLRGEIRPESPVHRSLRTRPVNPKPPRSITRRDSFASGKESA